MAPLAATTAISTVAVAPAPPCRTKPPLLHRASSNGASRLPRGHAQVAAVVFTFACHVMLITATLTFARLHLFIQSSTQVSADFQLVGAHMIGFFEPVKIACVAAAACHVVAMLFALQTYLLAWLSGSKRRIAAWPPSFRHISSITSVHDGPCDEPSSSLSSSLCARSCRWMYALFTTYPTETAQVRLLLEIALQAFQAHKMSSLVTSVWLNRLMAIVLVLNCWFTPLIFVAMRRYSHYTKRVVRLTLDTLLDVVYTVGIPTAILLPYAQDVDTDSELFPLHYYVMDAWTSVTASELRQVFVSSWVDYVSKVFPWLCVCYRLHALRSLLVSSTRPSPRFVTASTSRVSFALNTALAVCGAAVLVVHLQTASLADTSSTRGCLVEMRPWFASSHTCTVVEISCSQRQIVGTRTEISKAFAEFAADRVYGLVVSHCPQFEMPPDIRMFSQIALFKFYNSTISQWGADAAITAATNPNVQQFFAIYTNFSTFPEGLLSSEMPQTLRDVKFIATDLTHFPESLAYAWRSVKYFAVELSVGMLDFPVVLAALPSLLYVCLSSNNLVSLSDQRLQQLSVNALQLGSNPIATIPESFGRPDTIALLSIKHTNISSLPSTWLATKDDASLGSVLVIADATPLCTHLEASQVDAATPARSFPNGRFLVLCVDRADYFPNVSYPLELEKLWREPNRYN